MIDDLMTSRKRAHVARARAAACLLLACSIGHDAFAQGAITWRPCVEADGIGIWPVLGERLQCAEVVVPVDHQRPAGKQTRIDVIRVRAADPGWREGSIFFNPGGPGGHPGGSLPGIAQRWTLADLEAPDGADLWALASRYDLVGVVPRGLGKRWKHDCLAGFRSTAAFLPTHLDDDNWNRTIDDARTQATHCRALPDARYINTAQHVHDMDVVRRALGDQRIHFYGVSYGGLVGPWYAVTYPEHIGRMLLDSPLYFRGNYQQALQLTLDFMRDAIDVVTRVTDASPESLGLPRGTDAASSLWSLPPALREAWHDRIYSPYLLAAALHIRPWLGTSARPDWAALARRVRPFRFSDDPETDGLVRNAANELLANSRAAPGPLDPDYISGSHRTPGRAQDDITLGPVADSVWLTTLCNDGPWWGSPGQIRARAEQWATSLWTWDGRDVAPYLVCSMWGGHSADRPDFARLASGAPFLLLQAEFDMATPKAGSAALMSRYDNAHLVFVTATARHGLFNASVAACADQVAAHYLATGELPVARRTECTAEHFGP